MCKAKKKQEQLDIDENTTENVALLCNMLWSQCPYEIGKKSRQLLKGRRTITMMKIDSVDSNA